MDDRYQQALAMTPASPACARTIDITMTGARTGRLRRIEIWFYLIDGEIYLTTQPARHSWYSNLIANPEFTFHLKHSIQADLVATAEPVLGLGDRELIFTALVEGLNQPLHRRYLSQSTEPVEDVAGDMTYFDLSEAGTDTLRCTRAAHSVSVLQTAVLALRMRRRTTVLAPQ